MKPSHFIEPGSVFGRLTVVERAAKTDKGGARYFFCRCSCGGTNTASASNLRLSKVTSCGCAFKERVGPGINTRHGHARVGKITPEFRSWLSMRRRCNEPSAINFHNYGGIGIKVCPEWDADFLAFLRDMGLKPTPKHTIERIDVGKGYEPGNCRWATRKEQASNTRRTLMINVDGVDFPLPVIADALGITPKRAWARTKENLPKLVADAKHHLKLRERS